jgi:hypothetical protein
LKPEWEIYRIATFYGPVWYVTTFFSSVLHLHTDSVFYRVSIVITIIIYVRAGSEIWMKRRKMLNFSGSGTGQYGKAEPFPATNGLFSPGFPGFKTTEVVQTTEIVNTSPSTTAIGATAAPAKDANVSYSVTISADAKANDEESIAELELEPSTPVAQVQSNGGRSAHFPPTTPTDTRAVAIAPHIQARRIHNERRNREANNAIWSYMKCASLFFAALLITWIPSSGNRVYSMINAGDVSKPLFFASAFVLPLQGFWNAIIYSATSWGACKSFYSNVTQTFRGRNKAIVEITHLRHRDTRPTGGKWSKTEDSTSMEDLTGVGSRTHQVSPV